MQAVKVRIPYCKKKFNSNQCILIIDILFVLSLQLAVAKCSTTPWMIKKMGQERENGPRLRKPTNTPRMNISY